MEMDAPPISDRPTLEDQMHEVEFWRGTEVVALHNLSRALPAGSLGTMVSEPERNEDTTQLQVEVNFDGMVDTLPLCILALANTTADTHHGRCAAGDCVQRGAEQ